MTERDPRRLRSNIRLDGTVDMAMLQSFLEQRERALAGADPIVIELFTNGGDADVGRRIALETRLCRDLHGRETIFIGKTTVYSAGVTIMAAVPAAQRFLTRDTVLLIHERRLEKDVRFSGPLRANLTLARSLLAELEAGIALEDEGFRDLAAGSGVAPDEVKARAGQGWYLTATEAAERGLVAGLF
jgi:ATP-dependent Clp protease, protease subunit